MGIDETLKKVFEVRGMSQTIGINRHTWGSMKSDFINNRNRLSLEKKISILEKVGYRVDITVIDNEISGLFNEK
jgi:hypothetical protein